MGAPVEVGSFGTLNLITDPEQVGAAAVDMLNIESDLPDRIRSRDGYAKFTSVAGAAKYDSVFGWPGVAANAPYVIAGLAGANGLEAFNSSGVVVHAAARTASSHTFAAWGSSTKERVFCANGVDALIEFQPSVPQFAAPVFAGAAPTGRLVAATSPDNRLVNANFSTNRSRVMFSDAGDAYTFTGPANHTDLTAGSYVDLTPGDGEEIVALASWENVLIAFKNTKYFVFYGTTEQSDGSPIFNYTTVNAGVGPVGRNAVAVAPEGVYFLDRRGVYLTNGQGSPQLVSRDIDPLFLGISSSVFTSSAINQSAVSSAALAFHDDRLYVAVPSGSSTTNDLMLVKTRAGWLLWSIAASALASWRLSSAAARLLLPYATGTNHIGQFSTVPGSLTTDDGAAISAKYRTGFLDFGSPGQEKVVRAWLVDGCGTVNVKSSVNDGSLGSAAALVLGTSPAVARAQDRRSVRGRNFSVEFSTSSGAWQVSRLIANVNAPRAVGVQTS